MPIGTNDAVEKFGTPIALEASGGSATSGAFVQTTADIDNVDDVVSGHLHGSFTFAANPVAGTTLDVYLRQVTGYSQTAPASGFPHIYAGSIPLNTDDVSTVGGIDVALPNVAAGNDFEVFLRNNAGATLNAGWQLTWTPKAIGPKP